MAYLPFPKEPKEVAKVNTAHRTICTKVPAEESLALFHDMEKYETYSNSGLPLVVWHHTEDGYKVCDPWGNKWIDFSSSILINNCGHGHQDLIDAIDRVIKKPMLSAYLFCTEERIEAAKELISVCPIPDAKVFMLSSGSEATDAAFKMMRTYGKKVGGPEKKIVITFQDSFHGRTLGAQLLGGIPELKDWIGNVDPDMFQTPYPNAFQHPFADPESPEYDEDKQWQTFLDTIEKNNIDPDKICGVCMGGYHEPLCQPAPKNFVQRLRKFCDEHNALLTIDEVQSGACRSGTFWAFEQTGIIPDLFTAAKGMSGAMPQSALFGRREIMDLYAPGDLTSTHSGSPIASAATAANIRYLRDNKVWEMAAERGKIVMDFMKDLQKKFPHRIGMVSGQGLLFGVGYFDADKKPQPEFCRAVLMRSIEKGVLFTTPVFGGCVSRIVPPCNIPIDALMEGLQVYAEAVAECDAEMPPYNA